MSAASTYLEQQNRVLDLISKSDSTTRNRVKNWLNLAYQDFVLRELWPFRETTGTISLVATTQEYSLETNFTDIDAQNIVSVAIQGAAAKKLTYWPYNQLRASQPDFDLAGAGTPERYYLKGRAAGAYNIGFWPVPDAALDVAIDYLKVPTEMSDDADEPIIPIAYREALVQYALSLEHDYNTDADLAQKAMNRYEDIVTLARQNLLTQPNDTNNFRVLGPHDSVSHTGLPGEVR